MTSSDNKFVDKIIIETKCAIASGESAVMCVGQLLGVVAAAASEHGIPAKDLIKTLESACLNVQQTQDTLDKEFPRHDP